MLESMTFSLQQMCCMPHCNMSKTLQQCKALLRKGGLLIANELSAKTDFLTLTFGLTDGWWLFDDAKLRIPGSPIISRCAVVCRAVLS